MAADPFDLDRFVQAQDAHDTYAVALTELRRGRKTSHWMWFVFPQVAGLGHSPTAQRYAVGGPAEARAYLAHPVLGPRLDEATRAVLDGPATSARELLGPIDAVKLRSSMTLFAVADPARTAYRDVLVRFYDGQDDPATLALLPAD